MTTKHCPRCLEPLREKALVANVEGAEMCVVCAAKRIGDDVGVDADLAQGLAATLLGQRRGNVFLSSYVQRKSSERTGVKPGPPMDPIVAQGLGLASVLAEAFVDRARTKRTKKPWRKK